LPRRRQTYRSAPAAQSAAPALQATLRHVESEAGATRLARRSRMRVVRPPSSRAVPPRRLDVVKGAYK
jgi:hypothetical protein